MNTITIPQRSPSPFLTIWTSPRATIRHILKTDPDYMVLPLAAIAGIGMFLNIALRVRLGGPLSLGRILLLAMLIGPVLGLVSFFLHSWLLYATGRWLGGKADQADIQTVVAWARIPAPVDLVVLWGVLTFIDGRQLFTFASLLLDPGARLQPPVVFLLLISMLMAVWSLVILCQGLGEVQGFSAWKGLLNVILAPFFILGPVLLLVSLFIAYMVLA